jgi:outer membrane receptor for Fe3+-dicitrate
MKKIILSISLILMIASAGYSQGVISSSSNTTRGDFANEVKVNFLNLIVLASVEVGYEKFLSDNHSLDVQLHINDRFGYNSQGDGKNYKTNAVQASVNFYLGDGQNGRVYIYPLAKLRFGDFEEAVNGALVTTSMNAFILGAGAGYKWEFSNFAFGPYASVARGFSSEVADRFAAIEVNGGFSLGYRF